MATEDLVLLIEVVVALALIAAVIATSISAAGLRRDARRHSAQRSHEARLQSELRGLEATEQIRVLHDIRNQLAAIQNQPRV